MIDLSLWIIEFILVEFGILKNCLVGGSTLTSGKLDSCWLDLDSWRTRFPMVGFGILEN